MIYTGPQFYFTVHPGDLTRSRLIPGCSIMLVASAHWVDTLIYLALGERSRLVRVNGSNVVSAGVDSVLFLGLAFGWPPLWAIVAGQFAAKVLGGFLWSIVLGRRWNLSLPAA